MDDDEKPSERDWVTWFLYNFLMLAFGTIVFAMGINWLRDLGGWTLIQKANNGAGNLITASVALLALAVAYREYRIRNGPTFYGELAGNFIDPNYLLYDLYIVSAFDKLIYIETEITGKTAASIEVLMLNRYEVVKPTHRTAVLSLKIHKDSLRQSDEAITIKCLGYSAANSDSRALLTLQCVLSLSRISPGQKNAIESYKLEQLRGRLDLLP